MIIEEILKDKVQTTKGNFLIIYNMEIIENHMVNLTSEIKTMTIEIREIAVLHLQSLHQSKLHDQLVPLQVLSQPIL